VFLLRMLAAWRLISRAPLALPQDGQSHPKRAAAHVVESEPMAEFYALRFTPVFPTDTKFDIWAGLMSQVASNLHEFTNSDLVNRGY
jgi:hypothetical protein